jgi:succinate dehydrogenase/fumarate reductase cytochrome b subunit
MDSNRQNKFSETLIPTVLKVTGVLFLVFYFVYSFTKHFIETEKAYWIPLLLFAANFLLLAEMIYLVKKGKAQSTKKEFRNLVSQAILNLCFVIFLFTYVF